MQRSIVNNNNRTAKNSGEIFFKMYLTSVGKLGQERENRVGKNIWSDNR